MKTCILRAKLKDDKRTYRDIEVLGAGSLEHLAEAIVDSFDFCFDHCFGFYSNLKSNYFDSKEKYELFFDIGEESDAGSVQKTSISQVFNSAKKKMQFLFDYGDEWLFEVELLGVGEYQKKRKYPHVIKTKGKAPEQYPSYEEETSDEEMPAISENVKSFLFDDCKICDVVKKAHQEHRPLNGKELRAAFKAAKVKEN